MWGEAAPPAAFFLFMGAKHGAERVEESSGMADTFQPFCPRPSSPLSSSTISSLPSTSLHVCLLSHHPHTTPNLSSGPNTSARPLQGLLPDTTSVWQPVPEPGRPSHT